MTYDFHFLLMRCFNLCNHQITREITAIGLFPGQPKILECLREQDGAKPKDIGLHCGIDKSTMSSLLRKMEEKELIIRCPDKTDRRAVRIWLTDSGRAAAEKVASITETIDRRALQGLSTAQKQELQTALQTVLQTLQKGE